MNNTPNRAARRATPEQHGVRRDRQYPLWVDGTILDVDARHDTARATVSRNDGGPLILPFDLDDISALKKLVGESDDSVMRQ